MLVFLFLRSICMFMAAFATIASDLFWVSAGYGLFAQA